MLEEPISRRKKGLHLHAIKIGAERQRYKPHNPIVDKYIDVCLNCAETQCKGDCKRMHGGKKT